MGVMASSPPLLKAYLRLNELFEETSLSAVEQQVVILSISAANECEYCVAAHTITARMQKVSDDVINSIRTSQPIADARLESLRRMTETIVKSRGWPDPAVVDTFLSEGFRPEQMLEVILAVVDEDAFQLHEPYRPHASRRAILRGRVDSDLATATVYFEISR